MIQYRPREFDARTIAEWLKLTALPVAKTCRLLLLLILGSFTYLHVSAQQETDYVVHANIIYRFTKYIDWPANTKTGDFIIGIIGDSPLYEEMKKNIAGKMVGDQKISVKKYSSSAEFNCQVLFISEDESKNIKKIAARTAYEPVLLITETEGMAQKGSCINFVIVTDRLKLEINKTNIEQRELGIASELLQLGKIIK